MTRILPVFVPHAGCRHEGLYCDQHAITGTRKNRVRETMSAALGSITQPHELAFYGGTFTAIPSEERRSYLEAAQEYIKDGRVSSIRISTHPLYIDEVILDELWSFGVRTIELGAQSMDDAVLSASGRGHSAEDVTRASRLVLTRGFKLGLQQMTALPLASVESDVRSAELIRDLEPWGVRIYPTVVLRGTPLEALWRDGRYAAETVDEAVERAASVLRVYRDADIKILRIGLHASEELERNVLAGGYHPRLGEMVRKQLAQSG